MGSISSKPHRNHILLQYHRVGIKVDDFNYLFQLYQNLLVLRVEEKEIVRVLRLYDVFKHVCSIIKNCASFCE